MNSMSSDLSNDPAESADNSGGKIRDNVTSESIKIRREDPEEMASRLRQQEADANLRRRRDAALFIVALVATVAILGACLWIVLNPSVGPETKEWARSITTLIIGGFVGYLTGRALG